MGNKRKSHLLLWVAQSSQKKSLSFVRYSIIFHLQTLTLLFGEFHPFTPIGCRGRARAAVSSHQPPPSPSSTVQGRRASKKSTTPLPGHSLSWRHHSPMRSLSLHIASTDAERCPFPPCLLVVTRLGNLPASPRCR
jgi:hypothetical protein